MFQGQAAANYAGPFNSNAASSTHCGTCFSRTTTRAGDNQVDGNGTNVYSQPTIAKPF